MKSFYEDIPRWGSTFQVNALFDTVANESKTMAHYFDGDIVVMERSSFSVINLFSKTLLNKGYLQTVEGDIKKLRTTLPLLCGKNVHIFYLWADPQICYERLMKRDRQEEVSTTSLEYLKRLHDIHEEEISVGKVNNQLQILDGHKKCLADKS